MTRWRCAPSIARVRLLASPKARPCPVVRGNTARLLVAALFQSTISLEMVHQVTSTQCIKKLRGEPGLHWRGRFFGQGVKEYYEKMWYIHLNSRT